MFQKYQKTLFFLIFLCLANIGFGQDKYREVQKNLQNFYEVYKQVNANYVDEIDTGKFLKSGINGMLKTLDPYTVLFEKEDTRELDILKYGKYTGIGVQVSMEDEVITVISLIEDAPAHRKGIQIGDILLEINGVSMKNKTLKQGQKLLRVPLGSEISLKIKRFTEDESLDYVLKTEEITIHNVPYSGFVEEGIGYVKLTKFSRSSDYEVREAILKLKEEGELNGLILDLRGNPGGLLDVAVKILSCFLPPNELVVYTKPKSATGKRDYFTSGKPVFLDKPLAILVDEGSASASEIVAGAIQDLDRGIVIGTTTYGKGLVQSEISLKSGDVLKITTAKYYVPSGRCVQKIDYSKNDIFEEGFKIKENNSFTTLNGRTVFGGQGVSPDVIFKEEKEPKLLSELKRKGMYSKFITKYLSENPEAKVLPESSFAEFVNFLEENSFNYTNRWEKNLDEILTEMNLPKMDSLNVSSKVQELKNVLASLKQNEMELNKQKINDSLQIEFLGTTLNFASKLEYSVKVDSEIKLAKKLLVNNSKYQEKLFTTAIIGEKETH
ncbi:MAG: S41 family peptidase [Calditrichaeota bacterium]|nr:MAG: S41 family peptidase [Calditrichota bacterium]